MQLRLFVSASLFQQTQLSDATYIMTKPEEEEGSAYSVLY